jgi:hypothetical protein
MQGRVVLCTMRNKSALFVVSFLAGCSQTVPMTGNTATGGSGSATLTWTASETNTDGSPLHNLSGYRIYFGTDTNDLSQLIAIVGYGATSYVMKGLAPGTYYFVVSAFNSEGQESAKSDIASKTI